jgi:hypothetical protein
MNAGRTVFAQLIAHLSHVEFQKCVTRYDGDHHHRCLSCWDQYLALAFAQFTYRESLRDIEACLHVPTILPQTVSALPDPCGRCYYFG